MFCFANSTLQHLGVLCADASKSQCMLLAVDDISFAMKPTELTETKYVKKNQQQQQQSLAAEARGECERKKRELIHSICTIAAAREP